jgi:phosphoribosylaminoimidazole-succinocarboxamide synthase
VCGVALPAGLLRGSRLPEPIFTPATKEAVGTHDENIDFERACAIAGGEMMRAMRAMSLAIYAAAHQHADSRGLILADTKFEFGIPLNLDGSDAGSAPMLVDEALTPDSSRYWDKAAWKPGGEQAGFDKQFLREFLNGLTARGAWRKQPPGPELPPEVVEGTRSRYEEVRRRLFGA